MEPYQASSAI
ncbi:hypothetical protein ACHAW6_000231 [Cyclotella cf. meneghiniana]